LTPIAVVGRRKPPEPPFRTVICVFLVIEEGESVFDEDFRCARQVVEKYNIVFENETFHLLPVMTVVQHLGVFCAIDVVEASVVLYFYMQLCLV
jgi:hypothetical protein